MKTIKIIDLLNKIANGEQPKKIKYNDTIYNFEEYKGESGYVNKERERFKWFAKEIDCDLSDCLNDEVEIIEEEKKIPEKLDVINWDKCIHGVTHKEKELAIEINKTQELLNQVIDYLKSKGE